MGSKNGSNFCADRGNLKLVDDITAVFFSSVTDHFVQVSGWMRLPAPAGGPTRTSLFSDHHPGAMLPLYPRRILTVCAINRLASSHRWLDANGWMRWGLPGVARSAIRRRPYNGKLQACCCCCLTAILRRPMPPARSCT